MFNGLTRELGVPYYQRIDAPATAAQKEVLKSLTPEQFGMTELAGEPIRAMLNTAPGNGAPIGGVKVVADNGWFAARPSGTEEVYKIYAESFRDADHLKRIQQEAQDAIAASVFGGRCPMSRVNRGVSPPRRVGGRATGMSCRVNESRLPSPSMTTIQNTPASAKIGTRPRLEPSRMNVSATRTAMPMPMNGVAPRIAGR